MLLIIKAACPTGTEQPLCVNRGLAAERKNDMPRRKNTATVNHEANIFVTLWQTECLRLIDY